MQNISTLILTLEQPEGLDLREVQAYSISPSLQGVMMEHVGTDYAAYLHITSFNPYSQYCYLDKKDKHLIWCINTLTDTASEQILKPLQAVDSITIKSLGQEFSIKKQTLETVKTDTLTRIINEENPPKARIAFLTPTAFKSAGSYILMPSVRLIFQNLFMHYSYIYENDKEVDQEVIDYIDKQSIISSYNLRSQYFAQSKKSNIKIPAFLGNVTISIKGPSTLIGLMQMLLKFGEYAGVGIKTSMGMGGMRRL